jgi:DNA-binding MarR family transcriptional regulator
VKNIEALSKMMFGIGRMHARCADQMMDEVGLFRGQGMLLKYLAKFDGLTHSEIAEKLEISPAAVTKVIKRLEEQNYLKRQSDPKDERISRIFMQPEGLQTIEKIHKNFQQLDEATFEGFSDEELEQLHGYLLRIQENLQARLVNNGEIHRPGHRRPGFHRHF